MDGQRPSLFLEISCLGGQGDKASGERPMISSACLPACGFCASGAFTKARVRPPPALRWDGIYAASPRSSTGFSEEASLIQPVPRAQDGER